MKAPPQFCASCQRRIGRDRLHLIPVAVAVPVVLCSRCFEKSAAHTWLYPDCDHRWHDPCDHGTHFATRAAAHQILAARRYCMAGLPSASARSRINKLGRTWTYPTDSDPSWWPQPW